MRTQTQGRSSPSPRPAWPALASALLFLALWRADGEEPDHLRVGALTRLTRDGLDKQRPSWSPDARLLAFTRHEAGGVHIWQYLMDAGRPESLRRLTKREAPDYNGVFSPDGKRL